MEYYTIIERLSALLMLMKENGILIRRKNAC